jgi:TnpA family transposase
VTNKVEAYNGFAAWLRFGNGGVIAENDPAEQEKTIKFNSLLANCVIFHTALDMTDVIGQPELTEVDFDILRKAA